MSNSIDTSKQYVAVLSETETFSFRGKTFRKGERVLVTGEEAESLETKGHNVVVTKGGKPGGQLLFVALFELTEATDEDITSLSPTKRVAAKAPTESGEDGGAGEDGKEGAKAPAARTRSKGKGDK